MHEELLWEQTDRDITVKSLIVSWGFKLSPLIWFWSTSPLSSDSDLLLHSDLLLQCHLIRIYFSTVIWFGSTSPHSHVILIYFSILIWFWSTSPFSSDSDLTQGDGQWKPCKPILRPVCKVSDPINQDWILNSIKTNYCVFFSFVLCVTISWDETAFVLLS